MKHHNSSTLPFNSQRGVWLAPGRIQPAPLSFLHFYLSESSPQAVEEPLADYTPLASPQDRACTSKSAPVCSAQTVLMWY